MTFKETMTKLDEVTSKPIFSKEKNLEISKNLLSTIIKIPENCIKEMNIGISSIKIVNMNNLYKIYRLNKFLDKCEKLVISRGYEIITNKNKKGIIVKICLGGLIIKELFSTSKEQIIINYTEWILKYEESKIFFFKPISVLKTEALAEKQRKKTEAKAQRIEKTEALAEKQRKKTEAKAQKIKNNLALEVWPKNEVDKIKGTEADKKDFYEKNKSKFVDPETYEASHILVKTETLAEKHITQIKGILTKEKFNNLLKDLELTKKEFSNIIGISYITINNWNIIPSWVNIWFENYIKAKDMDKVINAIKPHIKE
ncbi:hypothetical protein PJV92_11535 [Aliarcobacter butzleri]|uniref:Uncharacterized protein n=1 Tax=Aliarcobacter butzleri TaxID=28197 RepID=A0AAP4Q0L1_9BACT|nr:hypothetical protein [Aliarcobacter butzleri]MDN5051367.1 hypothetical protein [Aliarcobacter butzleri]MDN5074202.1 hypothetical protein [Aliarcobacter butzleri]MDN5115619.1 hypothetical protein [Aliarcobacter butzleri]MDN5133351.1 hypothetical protein [Aliarcobacter butzleri]